MRGSLRLCRGSVLPRSGLVSVTKSMRRSGYREGMREYTYLIGGWPCSDLTRA